MRPRRPGERGGIFPVVAAFVFVAGVLLAGVVRLGAAAITQARADAAADAAALAAAEELALGHGPAAAWDAAAATAALNDGARLERCDCADDHAEVVVRLAAPEILRVLVPVIRGHARAEVGLQAPTER
jgi:hypothetical protein